MNNKSLSSRETIAIGLMLFALFFGAGNMIFPPYLGQESGVSMGKAIIGFLITGVGLPLLGVISIAKAGDLRTLSGRVHPVFGAAFTLLLYLAIGPLFGIPRTGTVAYEIGITPFLPDTVSKYGMALLFYTIIFFAVTAWLSMNPSKLVDRIGKLFTPILLVILAILAVKSIITPLGEPMAAKGAYAETPFFKGFVEGYLTMDAIAALVFGIVVIGSIKERGISSSKQIAKICIYSGLIAAAALMLVYLSLAYIGASGAESIGFQDNGGALLSAAASRLFGSFGAVILGLAITFACLTTSIGLVSSCAQYFSKVMPAISYRSFVLILSLFSMMIANIGLTQLISVSLPMLTMIYPPAIVLVLLSFLHHAFGGSRAVYAGALIPAGLISTIDAIKAAGADTRIFSEMLGFLPLYAEGLGWVIPAIAGGLLGLLIAGSGRNTAE
ncbi:branched-chain amino acid transport system II carrier protein [Bacillus infantis]|uniref:branched-chain amino acid transport system II carrier protein n=1 Tax=Bacillus infantis TaxID=324767 RepID=UPI0021557CD7|nr:branched-chain amino acid transport system II carrier protein [Bacillus infantis]MCR6612311.1 branched-chain amino acid transport system II carrier protein [Bacillus infantis]